MAKGFVRDGHVRAIKVEDLEPGTVVREVSKHAGYEDGAIVPPYADATVISYKDGMVVLARPYLYATGVGTACPNVLMGFEKVEVAAERLVREDSIYMLVVGSRGQSFKYTT